jgi:hypothetical protein
MAGATPTGFRSKQLSADDLTVCFSLHRNFHLPTVYETADADTIQRCLTLGADSFSAVREIEESAGNRNAESTAIARAVRTAEEKATKTTWKLEQEIERLQQERREVADEAAMLRAEFTGLQASFHEKVEAIRQIAYAEGNRRVIELESKLGGLQENFQEKLEVTRQIASAEASRRVIELESKLGGLQEAIKMTRDAEEERITRLLERESTRRTELLEAKEGTIAFLKAEKERREVELAVAQEALLARRGAKANSAVKGQLGEEEFADMAAGHGWGLQHTAKESRSCDYRGEVSGMPVFFEIKAHEKRVAAAEVDKFKRDMNEHPEVGAGVFLALHATITGGRSHFWTEYTGDGRLLIFLNEAFSGGEEAARTYLTAINQLLEVAVHINKARLANDNDQLDVYKGRVESAEKYIMTIKERTRELINTLHHDKRNLLSALQASYERLAFMIRSIQTDVQMTLGALLGTAMRFDEDCGVVEEGNMKEVVIDEAGAVISEKPKRKTTNSRKAAASSGKV